MKKITSISIWPERREDGKKNNFPVTSYRLTVLPAILKLKHYQKIGLLICIAAIISSCSNSGKTPADSLPSCIRKDVEAIKKGTMNNPPVQIDEYNYNGKRVFLYTADCCDQYNMLYDENCGTICAPTGGMEGGGDHKCEDFSTKARFVTNIWTKK